MILYIYDKKNEYNKKNKINTAGEKLNKDCCNCPENTKMQTDETG